MKKLISVFLSLMLVLALPVQVLADEYDLRNGSVSVTATDTTQFVFQENNADTPPGQGAEDKDPIITSGGEETTNDIFIQNTTPSSVATVTLKDVNININASGSFGVQVTDGSSEIKLDGTNTVTVSGENSAGMVVGGNLTISGNSDASLTVNKSNVHYGCSVTVTGGATVEGVKYQSPAPEPQPEPEPEPEPQPDPEPAPEPAAPAKEAEASEPGVEEVKPPEPSYWDSLHWKLSQMEDDTTLTLDLGTYTWIPRTLIQTAQRKNITLILQWNAGEDITILPTDTIDLSLWSIQLKDLA